VRVSETGDLSLALSLIVVTQFAEGLLGRLFSTYTLVVILVVGFAFTLIQGMRKRLTYRMRVASSVISAAIAVNLISVGVVYMRTRMLVFVILGLVSLLLAYRTIRIDIRTWRWFREHDRESASVDRPDPA